MRRWRWLLCVCLLSISIGGLLAIVHEPEYLATATVRLLSDKPIAIFSEVHPTADDAVVRAQYYVLRSPRILAPVVSKLSLQSKWNTDEQGAVDRLRDSVSTRRLVDANIVELRASDSDPQLAADIANTVVEVYAAQANQPRYEQAKSMLAQLHQECDVQSKQINDGEENIQRLRHDVGLSLGQSPVASASENPFRQTIAQADAEAIDGQIRSETLERLRSDPVAALQSAGDAVAVNLATQLTEAQAALATLQHRLGDNHPRVQAARENVAFLASAADQHIDHTIEMIQSNSAAAQARATRVRQQLQNDHGKNESSQYAELLAATQREDVQRDLQKILSERAEKLAVDLQIPSPAAEMIEPAVAPMTAQLTPMQILFTALGIGLALGTVLSVTVDRFDNTIREADDLAVQLNLPILGALGNNASMLRPGDGGTDVEAYRMIRNSIDFADHTAHTICLTAATAQEGVSTTAANLAWTWAEQGARVLLIDADLHNPTAHAMFGISNQSGLIDYLASGRQLSELTQSTSHANISVLPAGNGDGAMLIPPPMTPQHMNQLVNWAKSHADIILFDTGPTLAISDTAIIAHQCDASVMVIRRSHSSARDIRRCVHILSTTATKLLGIVLTAAPNASWDLQPTSAIASQPQEMTEPAIPTQIRKKDAA
ncbi:MAG TPA: polysaccharide biosynthesis tyrosine autokinase [Tepidisphaeraceae bacterium]